MAIIGITAEAKKEFTYKKGDYEAVIQAIENKTATTGTEYWEVTFKGDGFGRIGLKIFDTAFGRQDLYRLYTAVGIDTTRDDVDTEELEGRYVIIHIDEDGIYNDKPRFAVKDIFEATGDEDDDDDDFEDEEEEAKPAPKPKKKLKKKPVVEEEDDNDEWDD